MRRLLLYVLGLLAPWRAGALDNGVGRVPPMGWASWNTFVDVGLNE